MTLSIFGVTFFLIWGDYKLIVFKRFFFILILHSILFSQNFKIPNDPAGDKNHLKRGYMDGNRVYLMYRNTTELSHCCNLGYPVAIWPNNYNGTKRLMVCGLKLVL